MDLASLKSIINVHQLAALLGCNYGQLSALVYAKGNYRSFKIPKRSGGFRTISAPRWWMRDIQRELHSALSEGYKTTRSAHGFVAGRSIASNAKVHASRNILVNVDLQDFFGSISFWRVRGLFMSSAFELPYEVATVLAHICCLEGRLPQGAPTSPVISNYVCSAMDREIGSYVGFVGGKYTRYCDDLTMSFQSEVNVKKAIASRDSAGIIINPAITNIIKKHGFSVNNSKTKIRSRRERQEVTGLVVNEFVNVRREFVKELHTQLHCVEKFGLEAASARYYDIKGLPGSGEKFAALLRGRILFIRMIRGKGNRVFSTLAERFNRADISKKKIAFYRKVSSFKDLAKAIWVLEVEYDDDVLGARHSQGTAFVLHGVGIVTAAHVVIDPDTNRPYREIDIFRVGSIVRRKVFVASFDHSRDLAILFVEGVDFSKEFSTRFGVDGDQCTVGSDAVIAGFPSYRKGQSVFTSRTQISAVNGKYFEVGTQVVGGISGGPVLDENLNVIGVLLRGVPGGGAKNEAILLREIYYLKFTSQDLAAIPAAVSRLPIAAESSKISFFRRLRAAIDKILRRKS